jgi:hypothetical protein
MDGKVGIWIDHKKAVIVALSGTGDTSQTVHSDVGPHSHHSGAHEGERRHEARHGQRLDHFFDEVIGHLHQPEALLIFGPGEAKLELKERLSRSKALIASVVGLETTDKLTDAQIVAKVREHYELAH